MSPKTNAARAPLLVVTGTGTGIGKTHVTGALARAWARQLEADGRPAGVAALKPIESGVSPSSTSDAQTLEQASTFHVKRFPPPYMLARAVSPHLAAEAEGVAIELDVIVRYLDEARALADAVAVELPGGLFSPLGPGLTNADLAAALRPDAILLVVPDRLGVLHDVAATTRAAKAAGLALTGILVVAPDHADASTGTNARELRVVTDLPVLASIAREDILVTAARPELADLLRSLVRAKAPPSLLL